MLEISYLTQESQKLEAAIVDLQLRSTGETAHAICEVIQQVKEVLRHGEDDGDSTTDAEQQIIVYIPGELFFSLQD